MNSRNNINDDIRQMHDQTRSRLAKLKTYRDTVKYNAELFLARTNQLLNHLDNAIRMEEMALQPLVDSAHGRISELTKEEKATITEAEIRESAKKQAAKDKESEIKESNGKKDPRIKVGEDGKEYIDITAEHD
jgi:hypothetical protein